MTAKKLTVEELKETIKAIVKENLTGSVAKNESKTITVAELKKIISEEIAAAVAEQVSQPARASSMMSNLIKKLGPDQFAVEFVRAFGSDDQIRPVLSRLVKDMNLDEQTATGNGLVTPVAPAVKPGADKKI